MGNGSGDAQLEEKGITIDEEKLLNLRFVSDVALATEGVKVVAHQLKHHEER